MTPWPATSGSTSARSTSCSRTRRSAEAPLFILYAVPVGLLAGFLLGGRLEGLAQIRFAWAPVAVAALAVQILLFLPATGRLIGDLGPPIYVASTALVLAVVIRNVRLAGLPIVAIGAAS